MEAHEIRNLSDGELEDKLTDRVQALFNLRFQHKTGQLDNPARLKQVRRDIARMKTIQRERTLNLG